MQPSTSKVLVYIIGRPSFIISILLPICFIPGITGATIPTQWIVMTIVLAALWTFSSRRLVMTSLHWLGLTFVAYAALSLIWAVNYYDSIGGLWYVLIWALCFWFGSLQTNLQDVWKGLAIGLSVSSIIAILQALGYQPVVAYEGNPGLFYNTTVLGALCGLVILALILHKLWFYIPLLLPGLYLAHSRGGFAVLIIGLLAKYTHWVTVVIVTLGVAAFMFYYPSPSDLVRIHIWKVAIAAIKPFGWGTGTFVDVFFVHNHNVLHPEFAHNDYLQVAFEYGLGALAIYGVWGMALSRISEIEWPVIVAISALATFYFPLYCPVAAFITCVVSGYLLRRYDPIRDFSQHRRSYFLPWTANTYACVGSTRGKDISLGS